MIRQQLLLLPSNDPLPDSGPMQGPLQGSQGLLQTLLDLGETFLASELSEVDLQDLEAKLFAARSRDHGAIRDLQKKIEELSGMSAMVNRLKNELKEEKEKAKEEAEDLTQEMAELRYQLLQRVDEEREFRARTEEAYLRRITELEAQLKYAKQETSLLLGWKQSAEVQAQTRTLELQHLKSALEEARQAQNKLLQDKEEVEKNISSERQQLQSQVTALQEEFASVSTKLRVADGKLQELETTCRGLREENEAILLSVEQKRVEVQLKAIEEGIAQSERVSHFSEGETFEDLQTSEAKNSYLLQGVSEMLDLVMNFKLQLFVLASEYYNMECRLQLSSGGNDAQQDNLQVVPYLDESNKDHGSDVIRDVACITDIEGIATAHDEVSEGESNISHALDRISDIALLMGDKESNVKDSPSDCEFDRDSNQPLRLDCESVTKVKEIGIQESPSQPDIDIEHGNLVSSDKKTAVRHEQQQLTVQAVVDIVAVVTEEMTKLLRTLLKCSQFQRLELLDSLESQLQLWSNIPQKALPEKIVGIGVLSEWSDLVVDLLAQARRELSFMHQRIGDLESEMASVGNVQLELTTVRREARCAKEELIKMRMQFETELAIKEDALQTIEGKLKENTSALIKAQTRIEQQEASNSSFLEQLHKLEVEMKSSKSLWAAEKKRLEASLAEQHVAMLRERTRASKEIDKLERTLEELRSRLAENEQELEELVHANDLNIDAVVAAKLRQLDQKLKNSQLAEAELQVERAELASQVMWLQAKLEEAERELEAENEQHVEALIQYEEERGLLEAELEAGKQALHFRAEASVHGDGKERASMEHGGMESLLDDVAREEPPFARGEQKQMEKFVQVLKRTILEKDEMLAAQKEDLLFQKELNRKLMNQSSSLESELLSVRQELLLCESQAADMESTIANLQEALLVERMKAEQAQADIDMHTKKQDEDYLQLKLRLDELLSNIKLMQADLLESRRREGEASAQVRRLGSELMLAKEQVRNSELHLQNALKQFEGQLDEERGKLEALASALRQAELHLLEQADELKIVKGERSVLQRLLVQVERERDDFRIAYMDLESQASRRRSAFAR